MMNRPPFLAQITTKCSRRPERNLTSLAQGVSGAVPFPAFSLTLAVPLCARWCRGQLLLVKNVTNSFCIHDFSRFFTLVRSNCQKEKSIDNSTSKSTGGKTSRMGGSDPTFSASSRPKSFWGRSRPFCFNPGCVSRCDELEVNAAQQVLFTLAFTLTFTLPSGVSRSAQTISIKSACGSCTSLNHRVGLERPHFVAAESAAVAPAQRIFITTKGIAEPYTDIRSRV